MAASDDTTNFETPRWPNIVEMRARISRMDPRARFDAIMRLDALKDRDLHEHICGWPLPSWCQIEEMPSDELVRLMERREAARR